MKTTKGQRETYRQIVTTHAGALTLDESVVLALLDDADEADAMRAVLAEIAESGCEYGDDCPTFGTRHGQCVPCKARRGCAEEVGRG